MYTARETSDALYALLQEDADVNINTDGGEIEIGYQPEYGDGFVERGTDLHKVVEAMCKRVEAADANSREESANA